MKENLIPLLEAIKNKNNFRFEYKGVVVSFGWEKDGWGEVHPILTVGPKTLQIEPPDDPMFVPLFGAVIEVMLQN